MVVHDLVNESCGVWLRRGNCLGRSWRYTIMPDNLAGTRWSAELPASLPLIHNHTPVPYFIVWPL